VVDAVPGQFRNVDQAVCPAQVDERAEVTQPADDALADFAFLELVEQDFLAGVAAVALRVRAG